MRNCSILHRLFAGRSRRAIGPFSESVRRFVVAKSRAWAIIDYLLLTKAGRVTLKVLDITGRTVADLKPSAEAGDTGSSLEGYYEVANFPRGRRASAIAPTCSPNPVAQAILGSSIETGTCIVCRLMVRNNQPR